MAECYDELVSSNGQEFKKRPNCADFQNIEVLKCQIISVQLFFLGQFGPSLKTLIGTKYSKLKWQRVTGCDSQLIK